MAAILADNDRTSKVLEVAVRTFARAMAALAKGLTMGAFGHWVVGRWYGTQ